MTQHSSFQDTEDQVDHILGDEYEHKPVGRAGEAREDWRPIAFLAWAAESIVAFAVEKLMPEYCTAISAAVVASIAYWILSTFAAKRSPALAG